MSCWLIAPPVPLFHAVGAGYRPAVEIRATEGAPQREFVDVRADLILTNSFGGTAQREADDAPERVFEISKRAAELAAKWQTL